MSDALSDAAAAASGSALPERDAGALASSRPASSGAPDPSELANAAISLATPRTVGVSAGNASAPAGSSCNIDQPQQRRSRGGPMRPSKQRRKDGRAHLQPSANTCSDAPASDSHLHHGTNALISNSTASSTAIQSTHPRHFQWTREGYLPSPPSPAHPTPTRADLATAAIRAADSSIKSARAVAAAAARVAACTTGPNPNPRSAAATCPLCDQRFLRGNYAGPNPTCPDCRHHSRIADRRRTIEWLAATGHPADPPSATRPSSPA